MSDEQIPFLEHSQLNCEQVDELVDCYIDEEMIAPLRLKFEEHVEQCEACATAVQETKHLISTAKALREKVLPAEVSSRLRDVLSQRLGIHLAQEVRPHLTLVKS